MRSEHNGGASLAAFLLAVSTVTLLFVSPVEGQGTTCTTNQDCTNSEPFCILPPGAAPIIDTGECSAFCDTNAFPNLPGSCPVGNIGGGTLIGPQFCFAEVSQSAEGACRLCNDLGSMHGIFTVLECEKLLQEGYTQESVANCQRGCFDYFVCTTDADCPAPEVCNTDVLQPHCINACTTNADCPPDLGPATCDAGQCFSFFPCTTNADCPASRPLCESESGFNTCLPVCVTNADCPADRQFCDFGQCFECVTNTQCPADRPLCDSRECVECVTNADCPDTLPFCDVSQNATERECVATDPSECVVSVFPGETGSCPDAPEGESFAGPQLCLRTSTTAPKSICAPCAQFEQDLNITSAAYCGMLETDRNQTADVVANCLRECFGLYECDTNADCPDTLPICNAGQCEISVFSALDGMGGGSSA